MNQAQPENAEQGEDSSPSDATDTTPVHFEPAAYHTEERPEIPKHRAKPPQKNTRPHAGYLEPHRRDYVAPRTPEQTFNTFIWAIALMLGLSIAGYLIWLLADNMSAKLASQIESRFIQGGV